MFSIFVEKEEQEKRYKICELCEFFDKEKEKCKQCNCYMRYKTRFKQSDCPIKKW
jgi:hypothetical protein